MLQTNLPKQVAHDPLGRTRNVIFFASGFAGLIYESIWTHYLKLFLGHAAYAQTLVLAIFMGGMAIGAAVAARYTARIRNPLQTYAVIEAAIGVLAITFHPIFAGATGNFYDIAFAHRLDGASFVAIKWSLAALLILPQSILLGATFPLFAAAATRQTPLAAGRPIAVLYFANSIGGAVGVVTAGFLLIPSLGLPGTIATAGAVNLAIAALVMWMARDAAAISIAQPAAATPAMPTPAAGAAAGDDAARRAARFGATGRLLLAVSFLTGASSFIYEIGWIRMLSLVLGSATHSFELMLSAFVLGLALGGLWIRKRIDTAANPGVLLGGIQIVMGCAALATVPLHNVSFDFVAWVVTKAPKTDGGYALFNLARYGIASLIMFPAAFCAGMTLPLATRLLYSADGQGERAIGLVYSANTLGAIAGLGFAVHIGLPVLGLKYLVASGAVIDVLLGAALLIAFGGRLKMKQALLAATASVAGTALVATTFDPQRLSSGVFRTGKAATTGNVVAMAYGKTATISVEKSGDYVTIKTNGKPDATANIGAPSRYTSDQATVTLIGAIPLLLHDAPQRVANVGFGSGVTGETMLADPRVLHLDTIEIEPRMVELARHFEGLNRNVQDDPRSAVHIDDAKSFFAAHGKTYDVIVSEPSNPWVSGVAGLFSVEFYEHVARYLNDGGLFAQWLQTYETHPDRVISVLKAMDRAFDDYLVVGLGDIDILLIGKPHGKVAMPADAYSRMSPQLRQKLRQIEVASQADLTLRILGNKAVFKPWLDAGPVPANSDYVPYLDSNADRDRFLGKRWPDLHGLALSPLPIAEVLGARPALPTPSSGSNNPTFGGHAPPWLTARAVKEVLLGSLPGVDPLPAASRLPQDAVARGIAIVDNCRKPPRGNAPLAAASLATGVLPWLSSIEGRSVLAALGTAACLADLPAGQVRWRELLLHVADRNPRAFGQVAEEIQDNGREPDPATASYLLGMAMLGHLGAGNPAGAQAAWDRFSRPALGNKLPDLALEILRAHAFAGNRSSASVPR